MRSALKCGKVSEGQIKSWGRCVVSVRRQASAVSDYLALPELCRLLQSILLGTIVVFMVSVNGFGDAVVEIRLCCVVVAAWLFFKLSLKAYMAEKMGTAVRLQ